MILKPDCLGVTVSYKVFVTYAALAEGDVDHEVICEWIMASLCEYIPWV